LLANLSLQQGAITQSDRDTSLLLALEALPDCAADELAQRLCPYVAEAQQALDRAWRLPGWPIVTLSGHQKAVAGAIFSLDQAC